MSKAERARKAVIAAHKAAGTYVHRPPVRGDTVRFVAQESRLPRHRVSLLEGLEPADLLTKKRKPAAEPHQLAPPDLQTPWRAASPNTPDTF